ncbi:hypothetical protein WR25_13979 [Diploscapter pachys]|uniref:Protein kinase domain-containing protein n=1 Tax=Diploscapter pachys TaxID=2018661 RepID=A0A2A2M060_9BILA|nr:hypothetical protein WR25_13979 [Diploscapter pachys]
MKRLEYNLHIASMYGYVPSKFVPLMILEYCELGDILKYLIDNEENFKIADFGLAIKSDESDKVVRGLLPLKWTAPEAFANSEFSSKSDVWSFGVTLYEFYSLGQRPYHDIASSDLMAYLKEGNRLPKPELCPDEMYELMEKCWSMNPEDRLSFDEASIIHSPRELIFQLKSEISKCLLMITNYYGYLEAHEDSDPENLNDICPVSATLE